MISKGCTVYFSYPYTRKYGIDTNNIFKSFWTPEEVSLQDDIRDLQTLNDSEKHFIKTVLAFFANSEAMINENLATVDFIMKFLYQRHVAFISMQMLNESIHAEMYALQIEAYVTNAEEKDRLFSAIEECILYQP